MTRKYLVFVPEVSATDNVEYSDMADWAYSNLSSPNVLQLSVADIQLLDDNIVLDIINECNNSMIQEGEDDWIYDNDVKHQIKTELEQRLQSFTDSRLKEITLEIVRLLNQSIQTKNNLYFLF